MNRSTKIALRIPKTHADGRFFTFRLQKNVQYPSSVFHAAGKILAISDIEGNFHSFIKVLSKGAVIDKYLKWTFGDGHLVIVGDCFDRGEDVIECLWVIYALEEQARKSGGMVHFILGNHEIMNINGDWRYVHPKYAADLRGAKAPGTALYDGNNELWRWICTKNIMLKIGRILFVHGGISPEVLKLRMSVEEINETVRPWYMNLAAIPINSSSNILLNTDFSPIWYRGFYNGELSESYIDTILSWFKVDTIVTGHTIVEKVSGFYNNKVINIDTDHANGVSEGLLIKKDKFYRIGRIPHKDRIK